MFEVDLGSNEYRQWQIFTEWRNSTDDCDFSRYLMTNYPECIETTVDIFGRNRTLKFNSELDYTFFLLRVT